MSDYPLSVVLLIPAAHREAINTLAEAMGWGPGNMSRELTDGSATWYGCHTWAAHSFLDEFGQAPPEYAEPLAALAMSVIEGGNPSEHWAATLDAHGLTAVEPVE
jgi:hypothetical protein